MKGMVFIAAFLLRGFFPAQEKAVPVEEEPLHKVVLKNDYVEIMHVMIPPGQSSLLHTHTRDRIAVILSESTISEGVPGKKQEERLATHAGTISAQASAQQSYTHKINNVGKTAFEVIDVELLKRPDGPATGAITLPAAENSSFRAYRWTLDPGASTPEHAHSRPYMIIAATPMQLLMKAPDGGSMEHPVKAGDFHWIESKVTHTLANKGNKSATIIEIELR